MARTNLALALLSATSTSTVSAIAQKCGISQGAISKLISEDRRVDSATLKAFYTRLDRPAGTQILFGHLVDECIRAGSSELEWDIRPKIVIDADDLTVLASAMHGDGLIEDLPELVHHLANLVRKQRAAQAERQPLAAEDAAAYAVQRIDETVAETLKSTIPPVPAPYPVRPKPPKA